MGLFNLAKIGSVFEQRCQESSTSTEWFYWYGQLEITFPTYISWPYYFTYWTICIIRHGYGTCVVPCHSYSLFLNCLTWSTSSSLQRGWMNYPSSVVESVEPGSWSAFPESHSCADVKHFLLIYTHWCNERGDVTLDINSPN